MTGRCRAGRTRYRAFAWLGVRIEAAANDASRERISTGDSTVGIFVIPTNEELMIARHCAAALQQAQ